MDIETKEVIDSSDSLKFGWKLMETKRVHHGPHHSTRYVLSRDKQMPNYEKISSLERRYASLKSQLKTCEPMDPLVGVVTFILLIIPFIIYALFKSNQKKEFEEHNTNIRRQMSAVLKEVQPLL